MKNKQSITICIDKRQYEFKEFGIFSQYTFDTLYEYDIDNESQYYNQLKTIIARCEKSYEDYMNYKKRGGIL